MRIEQPKAYPLKEFFNFIPDEGLPLTADNMCKIAKIFNTGGVFCETYGEVVQTLYEFSDFCGLIKLEGSPLTLRKVNG